MEIVLLSHCSKKMSTRIQGVRTGVFRVSVDFHKSEVSINKEYIIKFVDKMNQRQKGARYYDFGSNTIIRGYFAKNKPNELLCFLENKLIGTRTVLFYLLNLFKCQMDIFVSSHRSYSDEQHQIYVNLIEGQVSLKQLSLHSENISNEELIYILNKLKVTDSLSIYPETEKGLIYNFKKDLASVTIRNASWVDYYALHTSLQHCRFVKLEDSLVTNEELALIVDVWKDNGFPKLEYLNVHSTQMNGYMISVGRYPVQKDKIMNGVIYRFNTQKAIKRNDGVIGSVIQSRSMFKLIVWL